MYFNRKFIQYSIKIALNCCFICAISLFTNCNVQKEKSSFTTLFETSKGTQTPEYKDVISFYKNLAKAYPTISITTESQTDSGNPLHVIYFDPTGKSITSISKARKSNKNILLINNGIHPGESDGIDASMLLLRDLAQGTLLGPTNTIIAVIPVYNIGGALQRNSTSRTNQQGPKVYGFRGNARNYDLNRDFIKADTKNAKAFTKIFRALDPELFIDNHVSNGADYQYALTHLFTQHNKLGGESGVYLNEILMPRLQEALKAKQWDITPYVNVFNSQPEKGFTQFMDSPRYSTGYTTLYNTLGMMVETHMLKPYNQRVEGTYELMKSFIAITDADAKNIKNIHQRAKTRFKKTDLYPILWTTDSTKTQTLQFKGYQGDMIPSEVTGKMRLKFDHSKPFVKPTLYYNTFKPSKEITIPAYYGIPKGYWKVLERLALNKIKVLELQKDTTLVAQVYYIKDYKSRQSPYEGHYLHYNTQVTAKQENIILHKGDYLASTNQEGIRYLLETLEPEAVDSFFNWNFFDTILQQKEGFSPYVWEDKAKELLDNNPLLKIEFETKKKTEAAFASNWYAQLDWLHKHSTNYEQNHLRYPIIRVGG
jgi:hypothetical protein